MSVNHTSDKTDYISHHVILDKIAFEHDLRNSSFSFIELPKFSINKIEDLQTIIDKWYYFFNMHPRQVKLIFKELLVVIL